MTDLAQKLADAAVHAIATGDRAREVAAEAIRSALPVAQGEAVALHREAVRVAAVAAIRAATKCPDLIGYDGKALSEGLMDALDGIFYEGPAGRIAELEREVERLREALGVMLKGNEMGEVECQRTGFPRMITRHEMARKALAQEKK